MISRLYTGAVMHSRLHPVPHLFRYPVYFYAFSLDELEKVERCVPFFSYNKPNIVSLYDKDYLKGSGSIRSKLMHLLTERHPEMAKEIGEIILVTSARYFHYAFNPVSFYYCYYTDETLACIVAEVNNTFGERHIYVLDHPTAPATDTPDTRSSESMTHFIHAKEFHVSPFNDRQGNYHFAFSPIGEKLTAQINIHRETGLVFTSRMEGTAQELTSRNLLRTLIRYPFSTLLTMPRILLEAAKLYIQKGLPVYMKPQPISEMTFRVAKPSLLQKWCMKVVLNVFSRMQVGNITLLLPNHEQNVFGDVNSPLAVKLYVHDYHFFTRMVKDGDIGFGESYQAGEWDTDDLTKLLQLFVENRTYIDDGDIQYAWIGRLFNRFLHALRRNNLTGSKKNIEAHYDLSNEFFQEFLDPTMTYSCGLYKHPANTLEQAQRNKLQAMIDKAQITADDHVLEIGTGWGSFAIMAVQQTGCRITSITLSDKQYALARELVRIAGLEDRITVKLCDYRNVEGQYDKIVSIEMFEAVGHEYYGTFFATCDRLLKPNGLLVMQVITIADQRYVQYRRNTDWIQKYIFPGGICPSLTAMTQAMTKDSSFMVENLVNIGIHYARTLREWRQHFRENQAQVKQLGFDERFMRTWEYYLCYCEAGFNTRMLGTLQLVLTRPNNKELPQRV